MNKLVSVCMGIYLAAQGVPAFAASADDAVQVYGRTVLPAIEQDIIHGNFQEAVITLKRILTDNDLDHYDKVFLLEKSYLAARNMGYFKEAGEILELSYIIRDLEPELRRQVHDELAAFYKKTRSWNKCIQTHFQFLQNVKVTDGEKIALLFDIVKNYQQLMQYKKAERVLGELIRICSTDKDFAYVYYYQAIGTASQNEYEQAIKLFKKALKYGELTAEEQGTALYQTGFCYEILQDEKQAAQYYEQALPLYKNPLVVRKRLEKIQGK